MQTEELFSGSSLFGDEEFGDEEFGDEQACAPINIAINTQLRIVRTSVQDSPKCSAAA